MLNPQGVTAQPTERMRAKAGAEAATRFLPEHALFAAVLASAIDDLRGTEERDVSWLPSDPATVARQWIGGAPARVSFSECCQALSLDPDAVRRAVLSDNAREVAQLVALSA